MFLYITCNSVIKTTIIIISIIIIAVVVGGGGDNGWLAYVQFTYGCSDYERVGTRRETVIQTTSTATTQGWDVVRQSRMVSRLRLIIGHFFRRPAA
jgi:hypothetical protein